MFGWIPRWHPFVWFLVFLLLVAIVTNPVAMAGRVHGIWGQLGHVVHQCIIFIESI